MCYWQHEFCTKAEVGAERLSKILRRIVRVVNVPLELVSEHYIANSNVKLNHFKKFALHLFVLPKLVNLFFHRAYYLTLKNRG